MIQFFNAYTAYISSTYLLKLNFVVLAEKIIETRLYFDIVASNKDDMREQRGDYSARLPHALWSFRPARRQNRSKQE